MESVCAFILEFDAVTNINKSRSRRKFRCMSSSLVAAIWRNFYQMIPFPILSATKMSLRLILNAYKHCKHWRATFKILWTYEHCLQTILLNANLPWRDSNLWPMRRNTSSLTISLPELDYYVIMLSKKTFNAAVPYKGKMKARVAVFLVTTSGLIFCTVSIHA